MSTLREALRDLPAAVFADVLESDDEYLLVIDLPGATAETTEVTFEGNRLHVKARREKDVPDDFRYAEENRTLFLDTDLPLPPDATDQDASASMTRGVLSVQLPKRTTVADRTIPVTDA